MSGTRDAYRAERLRCLEQEVAFLRGERRRLEALTGLLLLVACDGRCDPSALLEACCAWIGSDPARPHYVEVEERQAEIDDLVQAHLAAEPGSSANTVLAALRAAGHGVRRSDALEAVRRVRGVQEGRHSDLRADEAPGPVPEPGNHHREAGS